MGRIRHLLFAFCPTLILWPIWPWYIRRLQDSPDDLVGLAALAAALFLALRKSGTLKLEGLFTERFSNTLIFLLWFYGLSWLWAPPLIRTALGFLLLAAWWSPRQRLEPVLAGLLLLALPLSASLDFFVGYPLRRLVTQATSIYLHAGGIGATADGATLLWQDQTIAVDAPCSGLGMLWTGFFLFLVLAGLQNMRGLALIRGGAITLAIVFFANVVRAGALFYLEAGIIEGQASMHEDVGLLVFFVAAVLIAFLTTRTAPGYRTRKVMV